MRGGREDLTSLKHIDISPLSWKHSYFVMVTYYFWTVSNFVTIGTKIESSDISNHDTSRLKKNLAVLHDDKRGTPVVPHCFAGCFTRHRNIASFLSSWPLEGSTFFCRGPTKSRNMTSSSHLLFICLLSFRGENCALTALCYVTYVKTIIKNTASG